MPYGFPKVTVRQSALGDSRHFCGKVGLFLLNAFAEQEARHAGDLDRSAGFLFSFLEGSCNRQVWVDDESLREKGDFLEELAHAAIDHLFNDGFRLAGFAGLFDEDVAFAFGNSGIDFFGADGQRVRCSDVHGDLTADGGQDGLVADRLQSDQNAELTDAVAGSVVNVGRNDAVLDFEQGRTTQRHVFADGADRVLDRIRNGLAGCRIDRRADGFYRAVCVQGDGSNAANDILEGIVTGNEVGL